MKKQSFFFATLITVFFMTENLYSQGNFSLHGGPSFAISDFGDDDVDDDDAGAAVVGLNIGGEYTFKLNDKGLGLYLGADFNCSGLKSSYKADIDDELDYMEAGIDIIYLKYINTPITAGLNYQLKANDQVSIFGDLGLGVDIFKITNMTIKANNYSNGLKFIYKSSTQFAYKIGGGLLIQDKYIIGLHYNGLGKHNIESKEKCDGFIEYLDYRKYKVDILTLTFGIRF